MSSLHTLREAFVELERQADAVVPEPDRLAPADAGRRWSRRRTLVPIAAMAGVAVVAGAVAAGVTLWPAGTHQNDQRSTTASAASLTLWQAVAVSCPPHVSTKAVAGAVLGYDSGCLRLVNLAATFRSPLDARVANDNGNWVVDAALDQQQATELARATQSIVGDELVIVNDATVLSAATLMQPITARQIEIVVKSHAQARQVAEGLSAPLASGAS